MVKKSSQKAGAARKNDATQSGLPETIAPGSTLRERIARTAYELYEKRGWAHGFDIEDWLEAERLVLPETKADMKSETDAKAKGPLRERTIATKSGSVLDRPRSV